MTELDDKDLLARPCDCGLKVLEGKCCPKCYDSGYVPTAKGQVILNLAERDWDQPTEEVLVDDKHACMSEESFLSLQECSMCEPPRARAGMMWKSWLRGQWHLGYYDWSDLPGYLTIRYRIILVMR